MSVYKGDNTSAFDNKFITIDLENPNNLVISKMVFVCGKIKKEFVNPVFPIEIEFNEKETQQLGYQNVCYVALYDEQGRKQTCDGELTFVANGEVVDV